VEESADAPFLDLGRSGHVFDPDGLVRGELGQGSEQGLERGQMTGRTKGQGDAFLAVGDKEPAQPGGFGVELVLPVDDERGRRLAFETAVGCVRSLEEDGHDPGFVAPFPMAESAEVDRRRFQPDIISLGLKIQERQRGQLGARFVEDDGVYDRILGRGFVEVDPEIDLLLPDEFHYGEGDFLREEAFGPPRIAAVQVPDFVARQLLAGGVDVDRRVRPLVNGIGQAGAQPEKPRTRRCGHGEPLRVPLLGIAVGKAAGVGPRDDEDVALLRPDVLDEEDGGDEAGRFVGMGSSKHQEVSALFLSVEEVHFGIAMGVLERREIIAQQPGGGHSLARENWLRPMHGSEAAAGKEAEGSGHHQGQDGRGGSSKDFSYHLFDQEEPEEKERQDEGGSGLVPRLFPAEKIADEMETQVEDDEVVKEADHGH